MLILSRRIGEVLNIGSNITATVLDIKAGQIQIGIDAPKEMSVHREEACHYTQPQSAYDLTEKPKIYYKESLAK